MSTPSKQGRRGAVAMGALLLSGISMLAQTGTAYAAPAPEPAPPPAFVVPEPAPRPVPRPNPVPKQTTTQVTASSAGPVHSGPTDSDRVVSNVIRGNQYPAVCWVEGAPLEIKGSSERNWVKLKLRRGGFGYVNTVYLKGDSKGGVPNRC